MFAPLNSLERDTNVITGKTPLSLMPWIRKNLTDLPECEKCGVRARKEDRPGGEMHLRLQHVSPCSGLEVVNVIPDHQAGTHA